MGGMILGEWHCNIHYHVRIESLKSMSDFMDTACFGAGALGMT